MKEARHHQSSLQSFSIAKARCLINKGKSHLKLQCTQVQFLLSLLEIIPLINYFLILLRAFVYCMMSIIKQKQKILSKKSRNINFNTVD